MDRCAVPKPFSILGRDLPDPLQLPWAPWKWIRWRYSSGTGEELATLLKAYRHLNSVMDIGQVISRIRPREEGDTCQRCGQCCAELLPEPVTKNTILRWIDTRNPAHKFHAPVREGPLAERFYTGWYYHGIRLRLCPLLMHNPATGDKFCVVYHLGPGNRPPGCEGFKPNWPHCEVSQKPLVP